MKNLEASTITNTLRNVALFPIGYYKGFLHVPGNYCKQKGILGYRIIFSHVLLNRFICMENYLRITC